MNVFGVERNKCEHKGCKNASTNIIISGINTGCNTWVYCPKHFKLHKKVIENETN